MIPILCFLLLNFCKINGKFLLNADSSSIIVLRHIRLTTDNEYYRIRCPYHLNHLSLTLLNYSNENCFDLYTKVFDDDCTNNRSPCRFHAKPIQLNCNDRSYSNHVDVTYQCSHLSSTSSTTTISNNTTIPTTSATTSDDLIPTSPYESDSFTLHALSFPSVSFEADETIGLFLIGLVTVFILWITVCCLWIVRCGQNRKEDDGKCELLSFTPYPTTDTMKFTVLSEKNSKIAGNLSGQTCTGGLEDICVYVNPLENKRISSLKITQID